jgi:hypothetical protein
MSANVREADRDQLWLMPPSLADWLSEDHLAWFVLDVMAELDLGAFYGLFGSEGGMGSAFGGEDAASLTG